MIRKFIFAIVYAMFALNQSQARSELKNGLLRCYYDCDSDPSLIQIVDVLLQEGFALYNNYCRIAQYVADGLRFYPGGEWVVLIGGQGLISKREFFVAQFDRIPNTYILASFKGKHDVLVVKPLCEKPNIPVKGNIRSVRSFTDVKTDMPRELAIRLTSNINSIIVETDADYESTANRTMNYLKQTFGGRWFVMSGYELILNNNRKICGVAKKYQATSFNATYDYLHSIHLFSPVCN